MRSVSVQLFLIHPLTVNLFLKYTRYLPYSPYTLQFSIVHYHFLEYVSIFIPFLFDTVYPSRPLKLFIAVTLICCHGFKALFLLCTLTGPTVVHRSIFMCYLPFLRISFIVSLFHPRQRRVTLFTRILMLSVRNNVYRIKIYLVMNYPYLQSNLFRNNQLTTSYDRFSLVLCLYWESSRFRATPLLKVLLYIALLMIREIPPLNKFIVQRTAFYWYKGLVAAFLVPPFLDTYPP